MTAHQVVCTGWSALFFYNEKSSWHSFRLCLSYTQQQLAVDKTSWTVCAFVCSCSVLRSAKVLITLSSVGKRTELWYSWHRKLAASQQLVQSISLLLFMLSFIQIRWGGDKGRLANTLGTQARCRIPAPLQSVRSRLLFWFTFAMKKCCVEPAQKKKFNSLLKWRNLNDWKHIFYLSLSSGLTLSPGWSEHCAPRLLEQVLVVLWGSHRWAALAPQVLWYRRACTLRLYFVVTGCMQVYTAYKHTRSRCTCLTRCVPCSVIILNFWMCIYGTYSDWTSMLDPLTAL